ncbi:two-component system response regulator [uncultured Devosia sp.]|uniref:response regulator n=1 Tax=uncultured Devosia sp. TaxID=211434 RepID=UPI0035C98DC9
MSEPAKTVAVIAATPALSSILSMVLAGDVRLRVRQFDSDMALLAYMRLAPVDVLVCDFDREGRPAYEMVEAIRMDNRIESREVQVIALTRTITPPMRHQSISAGIDEVLVKPMSPRHLLQRVQARLHTRPVVSGGNGYRGPDRRNRVSPLLPIIIASRRSSDNVVQLFPDRRKPRHPGLEG